MVYLLIVLALLATIGLALGIAGIRGAFCKETPPRAATVVVVVGPITDRKES